MDNSRKRSFVMVNRCVLCREAEELIDHIPLHCDYSRNIWKLIWAQFGIEWVIFGTIKEQVLVWKSPFKCRALWHLWQISLPMMMWNLWKERNR